jgi:signal transduction histidine kinase
MLQTAIVGLSTVLDRPDNLDAGQRRILGYGLESVHEAAILSRRLLAFSHTHRYEATWIDLGEVIENAIELARHCVGAGMTLHFERGGTPARVWADAHAVEQAFINLCLNARDACDGTGVITVTVGDLIVAPDALGYRKPAGIYSAVTVTDNGSGMGEDVQQRLFEPYFTTKQEGKGTGLGLTQVYGAVRQAGGFIDVLSEVDAGSSITLAFPLRKTLSAATQDRYEADGYDARAM